MFKTLSSIAALLLCFSSYGYAFAAERGLNTQWNTEFNPDITRALAAKDISGCGQYRWMCDAYNECIVQCTRDGVTWRDYWVWPRTGGVDGPYPAGTARIGK